MKSLRIRLYNACTNPAGYVYPENAHNLNADNINARVSFITVYRASKPHIAMQRKQKPEPIINKFVTVLIRKNRL
jgi:hypothetical protein